MRGYLVKDIRMLLQQKKFFLLLIFICWMLSMEWEGSTVICYMTFVCSTYVLSSISYDEYDNGYPFLMTLPASRKSYAREKYLFGCLIGGAGWLIGFLMCVVVNQFVRKTQLSLLELCLEGFLYLPILFLLLSVMIPFLLKFGAEKGRMVLFVVLGVVVFLGVMLVKSLSGLGFDWFSSKVLPFFYSLSEVQLQLAGVLFFIASVGVMLISCAISSRIMQRKEF